MVGPRSLEALAASPPPAGDAEAVLAALVTVGRALRADRELPAALRAWLASLAQVEIERALAKLPAELDAPSERDVAESASRAALRAWMARGWPLPATAPLAVLRASLAATVGRSEDAAPISAVHAVAAPAPDARRGRRFWDVAGPLALAAALLCGVGVVALRARADAQSAREAAQAEELAAKEAQLVRLIEALRAESDAMAAARRDLAQASNESERAAAEARLTAAQSQQRTTQANLAAVRAAKGASGAPKPACTCQAGDPLCSCL